MPRISLENIVDLSHIGVGVFPAFFGPYADSSYKIHYRFWGDAYWFELYVDSETNWFIVRCSWDGHVRYFKADTKDWDTIDMYWMAALFDVWLGVETAFQEDTFQNDFVQTVALGVGFPFDYYYNVFYSRSDI